jgi:hypothetical protein
MMLRAGIVAAVLLPLLVAVWQRWSLCATAGMFGIPCPGCGLTRATLAALRGDLATAWSLHPLFAVLAPVYVYLVGTLTYRFVAGDRAKPVSRRANHILSIVAGTAAVLMLVVWAARFFGAFGGPVPVQSWHQLIR